jgi:hypothetical protein
VARRRFTAADAHADRKVGSHPVQPTGVPMTTSQDIARYPARGPQRRELRNDDLRAVRRLLTFWTVAAIVLAVVVLLTWAFGTIVIPTPEGTP